MQKNRRRQKRMGEGLLSIGYSLYQVKFVPDFKGFIPCPVELEKN